MRIRSSVAGLRRNYTIKENFEIASFSLFLITTGRPFLFVWALNKQIGGKNGTAQMGRVCRYCWSAKEQSDNMRWLVSSAQCVAHCNFSQHRWWGLLWKTDCCRQKELGSVKEIWWLYKIEHTLFINEIVHPEIKIHLLTLLSSETYYFLSAWNTHTKKISSFILDLKLF